MLSQLKAIDYWVIIDSDIENAAIWVEESRYVFHNYRRDVFGYNISVVLELVMPVLDDGQPLPEMEVLVFWIPIGMLLRLDRLQNLSVFVCGRRYK